MEIEDSVMLVLLEEATEGMATPEKILERYDDVTSEQLHYHFKFAQDEYWVEGHESMGGGFTIGRLTSLGHKILAELREAQEQGDATKEEYISFTTDEARLAINGSIQNLQINSNALGIQITDSDVEKVKTTVSEAEPDTLKRVIVEWLPTLGKAGIETLSKMLGV